jgi:hypothetical protein
MTKIRITPRQANLLKNTKIKKEGGPPQNGTPQPQPKPQPQQPQQQKPQQQPQPPQNGPTNGSV